MANNIGTVQPFLRWAGSKRQILHRLARYWCSHKHRKYIEPFAGSACLFYYVAPSNAIINDINSELICTYDEIKCNLAEVIANLTRLKTDREHYYKMRALNPSELSRTNRAARFIYLNRLCFNGLYRTNSKGQFNVPYGGTKASKIPSSVALAACSNVLQNALLMSGDFASVFRYVQSGDFVYLDPPYNVKSQRIFREYYPSTFSIDDLERLRYWMDKITDIGASLLVSYISSEESRFLSKGYHTELVSVNRNIAGFTRNRRNVEEVIISNIPFFT